MGMFAEPAKTPSERHKAVFDIAAEDAVRLGWKIAEDREHTPPQIVRRLILGRGERSMTLLHLQMMGVDQVTLVESAGAGT